MRRRAPRWRPVVAPGRGTVHARFVLTERDAIQLKVEAMLEAMTILDTEVAAAVGRVQ